jgi:cytochrome bd ubiquinol oxidase subunit II
MLDLPLIWAGIIATAVLLYVLLDGFGLGVGILFPFATPKERDTMVNSIAPVWDGNQTWLVLGGGGLFAAFPLAYAIIMPAMYLPIGFMLTALIFRGVAFEFRARAGKSGRGRRWWTVAFAGGSLCAALAQGLVLGGFLQGITVVGRAFAGGPFDWMTPFSFLVAIGLATGYALLGACWLLLKVEGELHEKARRWAQRLFPAVAATMAAVSIATLWIDPRVTAHWGVSAQGMDWPRFLAHSPAPIIAALAVFIGWRSTMSPAKPVTPLVCGYITFLCGFAGLAMSEFPNVAPFEITIWEAAAADNALGLMLVGVAIMLPVILGYTGWVYWVFRGKVADDAAYH